MTSGLSNVMMARGPESSIIIQNKQIRDHLYIQLWVNIVFSYICIIYIYTYIYRTLKTATAVTIPFSVGSFGPSYQLHPHDLAWIPKSSDVGNKC